MNKVIKRKWVKALRSGKYKQGVGELKHEYDGECKYCCLGVLCEVVGSKYSGWWALPPSKVFNRSALEADAAERLVNFNDDGKSFNWIASYIERYL